MTDENRLSAANGGPGNFDLQGIINKIKELGGRVYFHLDLDVNGWMITGALLVLVILLKL
jgi:hypothetical protein